MSDLFGLFDNIFQVMHDVLFFLMDFRMLIDLFLDEHEQEADEQEQAGQPDGTHAKARKQMSAQACAEGKQQNDAKIMHCFDQHVFVAGLKIGAHEFRMMWMLIFLPECMAGHSRRKEVSMCRELRH